VIDRREALRGCEDEEWGKGNECIGGAERKGWKQQDITCMYKRKARK